MTFVLASAIGCLPPADMTVAGFWESEDRSNNFQHAIELKANGEMLTSMLVMLDYVYEIRSGLLFVAQTPEELAADTNGAEFSLANGTLVVGAFPTDCAVEAGRDALKEARKERLGSPPEGASSLVGAWRSRHYTGAIAFERYTKDGRYLFRLPMRSDRACYQTHDGTLNISSPEGNSVLRYSIEAGKLVVSDTDGQSFTYRAADPWYPRDTIDYQPPPTESRAAER